jgi:hypothetical protein
MLCEFSGWTDPLSSAGTLGPFNMTMAITGGTCELGPSESDIIANAWSLGAKCECFFRFDGLHDVIERPVAPSGTETSAPHDHFRWSPPLIELLRFDVRWIRSGGLIPQVFIRLASIERP